jgi:hypothetical protein
MAASSAQPIAESFLALPLPLLETGRGSHPVRPLDSDDKSAAPRTA